MINFTVTAEGLEEQLLGDCVRRERPDLEEQRDTLLQSIAADKLQLQARCSALRASSSRRQCHAHALTGIVHTPRSWRTACCSCCARLASRCWMTKRC